MLLLVFKQHASNDAWSMMALRECKSVCHTSAELATGLLFARIFTDALAPM
jgi:hypothetical protein